LLCHPYGYLEAKDRIEKEFRTIKQHQMKMKKSGMTKEQIKLAIDPLSSFALQLQEEIEEYEKLRRGQFDVLENLSGIGHLLVAFRIFKGMKQKELAEKLGIKESQISRDERNEYHGASIEKIQSVLAALGITLTTKVDSSSFRNVV
jgi:ribosome-binding protein aMBF1 (putative translation factor)